MTQKGLWFFTDGFTGDVNDGAAPYTESEYRDANRSLLTGNIANAGVLVGIDNELEVTGVASPLAVDTGRAQVYGFHYFNTASVAAAVTTPAIGDTGFRVVLRCNLTGANNPPLESQVRVLVIMNADGNAGIPAMTQTPDVTWDIPLATGVIDTAGDIWTDASTSVAGVTDARVWAHASVGGIKLDSRQGGSATNWSTFGATDYTPRPNPLVQIGVARTGGGGTITVTFAIPFAQAPHVLCSPVSVAHYEINSITATDFEIATWNADGTLLLGGIPCNWQAIGERA